MYPLLQSAYRLHRYSISFYSNLIDQCFTLKSLVFAESIHARLIKVGFNGHTFLGNRILNLYSELGSFNDAWNAFDDIPEKNLITWNVLLLSFFRFGQLCRARKLFDTMPVRDVVSWNSMMSGYVSNGYVDHALEMFSEMQNIGVRPNEFTFSIAISCVSSVHQSKKIHGSLIRNGLNSAHVVLGNSLIDMYGRLGKVDYTFGVFLSMEELDIISWNSLISASEKSGYGELALSHFCLMRYHGYSPDQFTMSLAVTVCSNMRDLEKGKQIFALCVRMGFLSNSTVSSAVIDMFSKCNRLEDSVRLFEEKFRWDSALCNSMISSYARHGFKRDALRLFVLTLRENIRPTEFTLSSVLSCMSCLLFAEQGAQIHSLVLKVGLELDVVVASSLLDLYTKSGFTGSAIKIFVNMGAKDVVSWNIMIMGFARSGHGVGALEIFQELLERGPPPDRITLVGVLLGCSYGGLVDEGRSIFSSMEKNYGVVPNVAHYACVVDMFGRSGNLKEALAIVETMPHEPSAIVLVPLLRASWIHGDLNLTEKLAHRLMELEPESSISYVLLTQTYGMRGRWESVARVRRAMKDRGVKKVNDCSWIGIKNHTFVFKSTQVLHYGGETIFLTLRLLNWDMEDSGYVHQHELVGQEG